MTNLSPSDKQHLIQSLCLELRGKTDGPRKNIIVPTCPYCGKTGGKFGIYIGPQQPRKRPFVSHCFSCGQTATLEQLLDHIGRPDLKPIPTTSLQATLSSTANDDDGEEIDDSLTPIRMPMGWKRCYTHTYLQQRGFTPDDYDYFPVGTTRGMNFKLDDYVVFAITDEGRTVGHIARHTWSKRQLDERNAQAARAGRYQVRRYSNSTENDFARLLYNYDAVVEGQTDTVVLVEGVFDVIALTRQLDLYDRPRTAVVATFGKKISDTQIYKLQRKGVRTVVIGYDGDAVEAINRAAATLTPYFEVYIAHIVRPEADFDTMDFWEIYDTFSLRLKTPIEYKLNILQL